MRTIGETLVFTSAVSDYTDQPKLCSLYFKSKLVFLHHRMGLVLFPSIPANSKVVGGCCKEHVSNALSNFKHLTVNHSLLCMTAKLQTAPTKTSVTLSTCVCLQTNILCTFLTSLLCCGVIARTHRRSMWKQIIFSSISDVKLLKNGEQNYNNGTHACLML